MAPLLASAMAGLLVGATLLGRYALAGAVAVAQAVLVMGLVRARTSRRRTSGIAALVIGVGAAALVAVGPEEPLGSALLLPIVAAPGVALVAMAVVQLARREGRARLTASMTFGVTTAVLAVTLALWLAPWSDPEGTAVLLIALSGAATAAAFALFPSPRLLWVVGGSIAAAGAGLLVQASAQHVYDAGVDPLAAAAVAAGAGAGAAGRLWVARLVMTDEGLDGSAGTLVRTARTSGLLTAALPMACAAPPTLAAAWLVLA